MATMAVTDSEDITDEDDDDDGWLVYSCLQRNANFSTMHLMSW